MNQTEENLQNSENDTTKGIEHFLATGELLRHYFEDSATPREKEIVEKWYPVEKSGSHSLLCPGQQDEMDRRIYRKVARQLRFEHTEYRKCPASPIVQQPWRNTLRHIVATATAAVVVFLISSTLFLAYRQLTSRQTHTPGISLSDCRQVWQTNDRQMLRFVLPDGSRVNLNAGSQIEILKTTFNQDKREIWLSGEAFFEVAKNPACPFVIHTGPLQTVVHGTSFNVKAYTSPGEYVVSVRDGEVEIREGGKSLDILTANRQLTYYTDSGQSKTDSMSWQNAAGWRDGSLVLNGANEQELQLRLQQRFGVTVDIEENTFRNRRLSGTFSKNDCLSYVLDNISTLMGIHYTIHDKKIIITPTSRMEGI